LIKSDFISKVIHHSPKFIVFHGRLIKFQNFSFAKLNFE